LKHDIHIQVNGESRTVAPTTTVSDLLQELGLARQACAVEINMTLVPKSQHTSRQLAEADSLEIVTLVGGG
jgi:sulfur carrier protein